MGCQGSGLAPIRRVLKKKGRGEGGSNGEGTKAWIGHFLTGNGTGGMRHLCGKQLRTCAPHKWHTCLPSNHFLWCVKMKARWVISASFACHREKKRPPPLRSPPFESARMKWKQWRRLNPWEGLPASSLGVSQFSFYKKSPRALPDPDPVLVVSGQRDATAMCDAIRIAHPQNR